MYLAPINYDRFFKKVFSHLDIAKQFLEDFLEIRIQHLQFLDKQHFLTDDASKVEFDFRCTTDDSEIIIDMQQWYKTDVVKRFYTYHSAGTVLQLETIKTKQVPISSSDKMEISTKDYSELKPVITLIWMVDDTLAYEENMVAFAMTPEQVTQFIRHKEIWSSTDITTLLKERTRLLKIMDNNTKELDFLKKNRLIFMFQPKLSESTNLNPTIKRWFRFAKLTKNKKNKKSDFEEYTKDPVFSKIIRLIAKSKLDKSELEYLKSEEEKQERIELYFESETNSRIKEMARETEKVIKEMQKEKEKERQEKEEALEQKEKERQEKEEALEQKEKERQEKEDALEQKEKERQEKEEALKKIKQAVIAMVGQGIDISFIASVFNITIEEIKKIMEFK